MVAWMLKEEPPNMFSNKIKQCAFPCFPMFFLSRVFINSTSILLVSRSPLDVPNVLLLSILLASVKLRPVGHGVELVFDGRQ